jgi:hypothetical protein
MKKEEAKEEFLKKLSLTEFLHTPQYFGTILTLAYYQEEC